MFASHIPKLFIYGGSSEAMTDEVVVVGYDEDIVMVVAIIFGCLAGWLAYSLVQYIFFHVVMDCHHDSIVAVVLVILITFMIVQVALFAFDYLRLKQ